MASVSPAGGMGAMEQELCAEHLWTTCVTGPAKYGLQCSLPGAVALRPASFSCPLSSVNLILPRGFHGLCFLFVPIVPLSLPNFSFGNSRVATVPLLCLLQRGLCQLWGSTCMTSSEKTKGDGLARALGTIT